MKMSITQFYTEPDYRFDVTVETLNFINSQITNNILEKYPMQGVKFEELEIYICTDGKSTTRKVERQTKGKRGKYFRYALWLPYPLIVNDEKVKLDVFVSEFFGALSDFLPLYGIPENVITETKNIVLHEVPQNNKYEYQLTEKTKNWRRAVAELKKNFALQNTNIEE